jgi:hypothetical protein
MSLLAVREITRGSDVWAGGGLLVQRGCDAKGGDDFAASGLRFLNLVLLCYRFFFVQASIRASASFKFSSEFATLNRR